MWRRNTQVRFQTRQIRCTGRPALLLLSNRTLHDQVMTLIGLVLERKRSSLSYLLVLSDRFAPTDLHVGHLSREIVRYSASRIRQLANIDENK